MTLANIQKSADAEWANREDMLRIPPSLTASLSRPDQRENGRSQRSTGLIWQFMGNPPLPPSPLLSHTLTNKLTWLCATLTWYCDQRPVKMKVQHLISTIFRETEGGLGREERRRGILPAVFFLLIPQWRKWEGWLSKIGGRPEQPDRRKPMS